MTSTKRKILFTSRDALGIFGAISFDANTDDRALWRQIGSGMVNEDGSIDLCFDCSPTNLQGLQLRKVAPSID